MLKHRQKIILKATILEHIRSAKPVSSKELQKAGIEASSATIRNEMLLLDETGYLEQTHTSSGRIPTDKGYRFYVDNLLDRAFLTKQEEKILDEIFSLDDMEEFVKELSRALSKISRSFAASGVFDDDFFYETGFAEIFNKPEFADAEILKNLGRMVDYFDKEVKRLVEETGVEEEHIFIGEENPWKEARSCAMLIAPWNHPAGFRGVVALVGPKRTNYSKYKAVVNKIKEKKYDRKKRRK